MFRILITALFSLLLSCESRHDAPYLSELHRQYADYKRIFHKENENLPQGFEIFAENLQRIESYNRENPNCRMYLTQYSDTTENESSYNTCNSRIKARE